MSLDVLAVVAHPDDAELNCAGLLLAAKADGAAVGVVDLTRGELSSRGDRATRDAEARAAADILGLDYRTCADLPDGRVGTETAHVDALVPLLRETRPRLVVTAHWDDHHPDHRAGSELVRRAWYLAGVGKYPGAGEAHRGESILYYIDRIDAVPSLVLDITPHWACKLEAVQAYRSQLGMEVEGPATPLTHPLYLERLRARHLHFGGLIGVTYGEAYAMRQPVPLAAPRHLWWGRTGVL